MDKAFVEPPPFDLGAVYDESQSVTPLLFILTPGMDPTPLMAQLAGQRNAQFNSVSLGQGQAPKATKLLNDSAAQGFWAFLANCHLSASWLPGLEKLVEKINDEKPHKDFRLWLSSAPVTFFPIALLQTCVKMTTEPPKGLKANCLRLVNNMSNELYNRVKETQKYRKLFFSLVWFHATLLERRKFRTLGWNTPYDFNDSDFDICENILGMYLDEFPDEVQWDAMRYLIATANYGGRVTQAPDNRVLTAYCMDLFNDNAINVNKFQLSLLSTYVIPEDNTLQAYGNTIKDWPVQEPPEAFGQHVNAEIASALMEADESLTTLLGIASASGGGGGGKGKTKSRDEIVMDQIKVLESALPKSIDEAEVRHRNKKNEASPFIVVLLQEIERYNILLNKVRASLKELKMGIQGLVVISEEQELVFNAIFEGRVPESWLFAYPSLKPLASWMPDLVERIQQLDDWGNIEQPKVFWLAGFTYPTGFLTALLQASARKNMLAVDQLNFDFNPLQEYDRSVIPKAPVEGAYFDRFFLEGAKWNTEGSCLEDAEPMQLYASVPIILFKPIAKKKTASETAIYQCPLYFYPNRAGAPTRPSFMIWVEVKTGDETPGFWIKRGTAMLLCTG
jgi:dynein heavy chain